MNDSLSLNTLENLLDEWIESDPHAAERWIRSKLRTAPSAQPEQQAGPLVTLLAEWEDKNGTLAGITLSEWVELHQAATDAAVIESPRMLRNRIAHPPAQPQEHGDLYWRLHSLSKVLESSGRIDEHEQKDAYATILDAMNALRAGGKP